MEIINYADCMDTLCDLDDESVDLTILDPNYQDWDTLCEQGLICQAVRVTKITGNILCFTKQPFDYNLRNEVNHLFRREIVWTFTNGGAWVSNKMPLVSFQKIYWLTLTDEFYFNSRTQEDYSNQTKSFKRSNKVFDGYKAAGRDFKPDENGIWLRDHLHFEKPSMGAIPAKPLTLMQILVRCFCPPDGVVLDPFAGSGQLAIACHKEKRQYIGYENEKNTFDFATKRLQEEQRQLSLF